MKGLPNCGIWVVGWRAGGLRGFRQGQGLGCAPRGSGWAGSNGTLTDGNPTEGSRQAAGRAARLGRALKRQHNSQSLGHQPLPPNKSAASKGGSPLWCPQTSPQSRHSEPSASRACGRTAGCARLRTGGGGREEGAQRESTHRRVRSMMLAGRRGSGRCCCWGAAAGTAGRAGPLLGAPRQGTRHGPPSHAASSQAHPPIVCSMMSGSSSMPSMYPMSSGSHRTGMRSPAAARGREGGGAAAVLLRQGWDV